MRKDALVRWVAGAGGRAAAVAAGMVHGGAITALEPGALGQREPRARPGDHARKPWSRSTPRAPGAGRASSRCTAGSCSSAPARPPSSATRWSAGACGRGAPAIRKDMRPIDGYWAGNPPRVVLDRRGPEVEALIDRIEAAIASYPYPDQYRTWPGPNSNTFVAHIGREVPELAAGHAADSRSARTISATAACSRARRAAAASSCRCSACSASRSAASRAWRSTCSA